MSDSRNRWVLSRSRSGTPMPGMLTSVTGGMRGDWVSPPPFMPVKTSLERYSVTPRPRMLMATPEMMWSTPNVTVTRACSSPPSAPPIAPAMTPAHGVPKVRAPQAPHQVPRIIMPSRPMLTTPARSDHSPPRAARPMGTARPTAAPMVPPEVMSFAPVTTRAMDIMTSSASTPSSSTCQLRRKRRTCGGAGGAAEISETVTPPLLPPVRRPPRRAACSPCAARRRGGTGGPARRRR